jgi:hypothetical protein
MAKTGVSHLQNFWLRDRDKELTVDDPVLGVKEESVPKAWNPI